MPTAGTSFYKDNDYTLRVNTEYLTSNIHSRSISREFNFKSAQVTTISREWIADSAGNTVSQQMIIQNFSDIESKDEIRDMREKLIELKGNPPELKDDASGLPKAKISAPSARSM